MKFVPQTSSRFEVPASKEESALDITTVDEWVDGG